MKYYLTKEWMNEIVYPLSVKKGLKVSKCVDAIDEKTYQELYKKELESFMQKEKERLTPFDLTKLPWLDKALASMRVSKQNLKALKAVLEKESGYFQQRKIEFDEEAIKRKFDNTLNDKIETCKKFPGEILNEVADLRVFALGYVTEKVRRMTEIYLAEKDKQNLDLMRLSYKETNRAEMSLRKNIRFGNYLLKIVSDIHREGNAVYIEFVGLPTLVIIGAEIMEWETVVLEFYCFGN